MVLGRTILCYCRRYKIGQSSQRDFLGKFLTAPLTNRIKYPCLVPNSELKSSFCDKIYLETKNYPEVPLAGRLKQFLGSWKILTKGQEILPIIKEDKIFLSLLQPSKANLQATFP